MEGGREGQKQLECVGGNGGKGMKGEDERRR